MITLQMLREWKARENPNGDMRVWPRGHVGQHEDVPAAYLIVVGYAKPISGLSEDQTAIVDAIREVVAGLQAQGRAMPTLDDVVQAVGAAIAAEADKTEPDAVEHDAAGQDLVYDPPREGDEPKKRGGKRK